jgi:hypothetical protein
MSLLARTLGSWAWPHSRHACLFAFIPWWADPPSKEFYWLSKIKKLKRNECFMDTLCSKWEQQEEEEKEDRGGGLFKYKLCWNYHRRYESIANRIANKKELRGFYNSPDFIKMDTRMSQLAGNIVRIEHMKHTENGYRVISCIMAMWSTTENMGE